jgi:hypothetical protein
MLHAIAKAIFGDPSKIEFKSITDAQRISAVRSGSVDIVAHTMIITCVRLPVGRQSCPLDRRTGPGPAEGPLPVSRMAALIRMKSVGLPLGCPVVKLGVDFGQTGSWSCLLGGTAARRLVPPDGWREQRMASRCLWWMREMREWP